ncbi:anacyclamide/piricyclamide family prenylated cyclic peptide [Microcoleus sp. C2C3]
MKKSLRPQIVAPVQRETTATSTSTSPGLVASLIGLAYNPFAGEDAE